MLQLSKKCSSPAKPGSDSSLSTADVRFYIEDTSVGTQKLQKLLSELSVLIAGAHTSHSSAQKQSKRCIGF